MQFHSTPEVKAYEAEQKRFLDGEEDIVVREPEIYTARQIEDAPEQVETQWGTISVMPGDYVLSAPSGITMGVAAADLEVEERWTKL